MARDLRLLLFRTGLWGSFLAAVGTFYFLAGVAEYLGSPVVNLATACAAFLAALFFLYCFFLLLPQKNRLALLLWFLIFGILIAQIVLGSLPPTARDELTHHLALPKLYAKAGRILEVPFALHSYYPMLLDMLYSPWVRWGWDSVPKQIHGLYGLLTGLLLYAHLGWRLSPIYGLLGFLVFISTPAVFRLGHWAYVDLGLTFYSTASLLCLLQWMEAKETKSWLLLAGLSAGFALATKPNGLLVFFLLVLLFSFALAREKESRFWRTARRALLFMLLALVPFSPWMMKTLLQTGNPLFPLFGGASEGGPEGLGIFGRRFFLYGETWLEIAALPLRVFFSGQDDKPQHFDGVLNPILILFLPWVFKGKWLGEKKIFLAFSLLYFLYGLFLVEMRIRYILPIVPPLVILLIYGIHNVYLRIARPLWLFAIVIILLALNGFYAWKDFRANSPLGYLQGRESREAYLSRFLPEYPTIRYLNHNLPSSARVYFLFTGRRVYYCDCDYFYDSAENPWLLLRMIQRARNQDDIRVELQKKGLTHFLVREALIKRFLDNNLTSEQQKLWYSFAGQHLEGVFHSGGYSLYHIHG